MNMRERILTVYQGKTPDKVPFMLDISHWFYHRNNRPWDLSKFYDKPEKELINYHKKMGIGFYMPNLASFFEVKYHDDIKTTIRKSNNGREIRWSIYTSKGKIERRRVWEDTNYAWGIPEWSVKTENELLILQDALSKRIYIPKWERYMEWVNSVGDMGVVYMPVGYSGMGQLLNYWMGVEGTMYAICDWPETVKSAVDKINENNLKLIDLVCSSPAEIIIMGDNFSSDIQPPKFFEKWSKSYYTEAVRRLHSAGKYVAVHIDGRLRGSLKMFSEIGIDCADAITPKPTGDLSPLECRIEGGTMILSGGVPPRLWLPDIEEREFSRSVLDWLELKKDSPRLIINAGDQVPPWAIENRIVLMKKLIDEL